jgi:8-oxo-dGTP diphosphatase
VGGARIDPLEAVRLFPHLFQEVVWPWGPTRVRFELFLDDHLPVALVANVNLVPRCGDGWLVLQLEDGFWEVPGGTLEAGESYVEAMQRELLEEAGAEIEWFRLIGWWHCRSLGQTPHRQHLPFPEFYRVVAVGHVRQLGAPANPLHGEQVAAVECLTLVEVMRHFKDQGRDDLAELYALASSLEDFLEQG